MKKLCILPALLLAACGGGSDTPSASPVSISSPTPMPAHTGLPYYEMTEGTHQTFTIQNISAAHWDDAKHLLVVDAMHPGTVSGGKYLVEQYSTNTCASFPGQVFYVNSYSFNNTGLPYSGAPNLGASLQDGFFYDQAGSRFLGEAINGLVSPTGEPIIAADPIAGQHIHQVQTWYGPVNNTSGGCGGAQVYETGFQTDYYTVQHLDTWGGFTDVWITSLIETPVSGTPTYYEFVYARHTADQFGGLVTSWDWNVNNDGYACCNYYLAVPKQ